MRTLVTVLLATLAGVSAAQAPAPAPQSLGAVAEVRGLVTMSYGAQVATVQPATPVFDGARFVASSSGVAELKFENGCVLKLEPNEWVAIDKALDCSKQIAAIQSLGTQTAGAGFLGGARLAVPLLISAGLAAAVAREEEITPRPQ